MLWEESLKLKCLQEDGAWESVCDLRVAVRCSYGSSAVVSEGTGVEEFGVDEFWAFGKRVTEGGQSFGLPAIGSMSRKIREGRLRYVGL